MPNEYEAALLPENRNEYEDALRLDNADALEGLRTSLFEATKHTPDEFAKARRLGQRTSLPADVVARNFAEVERDARIAEYDSVLTNAPTLGERLRDPEFATLAQDDVRPLAEIEALFNPRLAAGKIGGPAFVRSPVATATPEQGNVLRHITGPVGSFAAGAITGTNAAVWGIAEGAAGALGAEQVANFFRAQRKGQEALGARMQNGYGTGGLAEAGVASGFYSFGNMLPATVFAVLTGNPQILLATGSLTAGGQSVGKALDAKQPAWRALLLGAEDATAEYATEMLPVGRLFKDLKAGSPFLRTLGTQMLLEIPTELAATAWQNFNDWTNLHPEQSLQDYLDKLGPDEAQTVIATVVQTVLSVGLASGVQRVAQRAQAAQNAEANAQAMDALFNLAGQSALRGRAADAFQQYVEALAPDAQSAFVNPNTLEQAGVDVAALAKASPTFAAQYQTAASTGTEVEIPISELAAALPGSGLEQAVLPYLRIGDADAMTQAEAKEYLQNQETEFAQGVQEAVAAAEYSDAWKQSATTVETELRAQLQAANRFPDDVTNTYAAWAAKLVEVWAARRNVTPEQQYLDFPLDIVAALDGVALSVAGGQVPEQSGVVRVIYRGTNDSGERISGGIAEGTLFAAADEATAKNYAGTGGKIERIGVKQDAKVLVEGTKEFAQVTGRRRGKLIDTMRKGENLKTAADDAAAKARAAGYDALEFTSFKDLGIAIFNEDKFVRDYSPSQQLNQSPAFDGPEVGNTPIGDATEIEVDGVQRPTRNSAGQPIHPTEEGIRNFWRWFGSSRVVDDQGRPLVVYHGTRGDFDTFDAGRQGQSDFGASGRGFYFSQDPGTANVYATLSPADGAPNIVPVYLKLENPLELGAMLPQNEEQSRALTEAAKEAGHDGIVVRGADGVLDEVVVFRPEQIKSATGNRGTFNIGDANILHQPPLVSNPVLTASIADFSPGNVKSILQKDGWAILTAENPNAQQLDAATNATRMEKLRSELAARGLRFEEVKGKYGSEENSLLIFGVDRWTASAIGNAFDQESVLTREGLLYRDGTVNPATGVTEHTSPPEDFYSRVVSTGALFSVDIDFDQRMPVGLGFASHGQANLRGVSLPAVHFSREQRSTLDTTHYGTGLQGAEAARLAATKDDRIRQRLAFYVPESAGVYPEDGVGAYAHGVYLHNMYDAEADPLRIWRDNDDDNTRESAVLDAGFSGYYARGVFGRQGAAVMLGAQTLAVTPIDGNVNARLGNASAPPAPANEAKQAAQEFLQNRAMPFGAQSAEGWRKSVAQAAPELARKLDENGVWSRIPAGRELYRDEIARAIYAQSAYHGSPYKGIDKFSLEHVGKGEGAQAFGWGLYFASERSIAEFYRRQLTDTAPIKTLRIGTWHLYKNESPVDYSPRTSAPEDHARAIAAEYIMLREPDMRGAWYAEGKEGVRKVVAEELDSLIARYQEEEEHSPYVPELKVLRRRINNDALFIFEMAEEEGQVYKVDIPEHDSYLDWDKPLSEQSEKVKAALASTDYAIGADYRKVEQLASDMLDADARDWANESGGDPVDFSNNADFDAYVARARSQLGGLNPETTGRELYHQIVKDEGGGRETFEDSSVYAEAASKVLNSYGISGIRYLDASSRQSGEGSYNYVVFDDAAIRILDEYYQGNRGEISFGANISEGATLALLKDADLTTFLHEMGHFQLEVMANLASQENAPAELQADMAILLQWFGALDLPTWQAMSLEEKRPFHEQFARGFEAYLFEGNAPTPELTGVFARFRAWLLHIYRSLAALNVKLTDEVRGVMGRMLATNEQIAQAEAIRNMAPLLQEAPAGVDPETWARYQADGALATQAAINDLQSRSLRDMQWLTNAKSRELRRLQRQAKDLRADIEAEVTQEVRQQPIYAARRFLAYGELAMPDPTNAERKVLDRIAGAPTKLDLGILKDMYGEGPAAPWRYLPTGKHGLAAVDGLHPDLVAQLFGFSSGDALVRELISAFPEKATIEGLTDQRMLERYGDLSSDDALARAAESAIHNEARARFVATEYKIATRSATPVQVIAAAAKDMATKAIAQKRIRDLKPAQFAAAEARAAKAAERALGASDAAGFAREVRNKLLNNALAREAGRAASDVAKIVRYFKKFNDEGTRKNIDIDYRDQIDAILERFDLREGQTLKAIDKRKSLAAWIEQQEEMGLSPTIDERVRDEALRKHFRDMTVEELRGLYDSVRSIEHLGRLKTKLLTAVDQREFAAAVEAITASIQDHAKRVVPEQRMSDRGVLVEGKRMFKGFLADHRKLASVAREMDGWQDGGVLWEYLIRPMNSAGNKEAVLREQATVHLGELLKPLLRGESLAKKTYFPDIGKSFSREERIGIALNVGNEINRERIMSGEKLNPAQLQTLLDSLSKEEWDVVQGVWDYLESFRSAIAEKERRITGVEPQWVEAAPVSTRHGTYRGGYYPIKYDPLRSTRSGADTAAEVQRQIERGLYARSQTRRGHLKARVETTGRSIRYDLGVLTEHVTQVIHDLAWHEYLIDANRLVRSGAIDAAIREHYGPEVIRTLRDTLRDIAQGELPAQSVAESWLNHIRHGATITGLGWRVTTSLLQPIGLTQSMVRIGPMWVLRGARHWLGDAVRFEGAVKAVMDKSDFMRLRGKTLQREINEIRNKVAGKDSMLEASYFYLIQKMQLVADLPTWYGAYDKAMAQEDMTEAKAIALADQAVIDAQGSGQIKDLSQVQRGSAAWKLFTNFYSFFNTTYNLTSEAVGRTNFKSPASIALLGVDLLLLYTIPAMLGTIMKATLAGDLDDEDKLLRRLAAEQISYLFGTMVLLREAGAVAGNVIDPKHGYGYTGPAGVRFFTELSALSQQIGQGEADEAFWKHLNSTAGVLFQYPAGQINATLDGAIALSEGRTDNPGALIVGTPRE